MLSSSFLAEVLNKPGTQCSTFPDLSHSENSLKIGFKFLAIIGADIGFIVADS